MRLLFHVSIQIFLITVPTNFPGAMLKVVDAGDRIIKAGNFTIDSGRKEDVFTNESTMSLLASMCFVPKL